RPVIIPDVATSDLAPPEWIEAFGVKSAMAVPLIQQDRVIGVMLVEHVDRATALQPWQGGLAMAIAGQLALALSNAGLYAQVQDRLRETTALRAVGHALSQPGSAQTAMRAVAREVGTAFGADMVGIYSLDGKRDALVPLAGYHVPKELCARSPPRHFALSRFPDLVPAWRAGRAGWSGDAHADPRCARESREGLPAPSVLFAPPTVRGEPVGAIFLAWWRTGREFTESEVRL